MINTKDLVLKLKEVKAEKKLTNADILRMVEDNKEYVSKTTISRVFADGSEDTIFRYEATLRPIANALLDIETIDADDNSDTQAMKSILQYKIQRIEELEKQVEDLKAALDREKVKAHEKSDKERALYNERIEFLTNQIALKDKRMDQLLNAVMMKDKQIMELLKIDVK